MRRKSKRNIDTFARVQQAPSRVKYMLKYIETPLEIYTKAYKGVSDETQSLAKTDE